MSTPLIYTSSLSPLTSMQKRKVTRLLFSQKYLQNSLLLLLMEMSRLQSRLFCRQMNESSAPWAYLLQFGGSRLLQYYICTMVALPTTYFLSTIAFGVSGGVDFVVSTVLLGLRNTSQITRSILASCLALLSHLTFAICSTLFHSRN